MTLSFQSERRISMEVILIIDKVLGIVYRVLKTIAGILYYGYYLAYYV
jgi:hypothetical protein